VVEVKALNKSFEKVLITDVIENGWNMVVPLELHPDLEGRIDVRNVKKRKSLPKAYPFTHGELVFRMKERGIGRPSTYATIIAKLIERQYVVERRGYLFPTPMGKKVYHYLNNLERVKKFLSEEFTKVLEELMDKVEVGEKDYQEILFDLYREIRNRRA